MQKITYFQNCHGNNKNNVSSVLHLTLSSLRFALKSKLFQALSRHLYNVKHIISDSKWYRMRFVIYPLFFPLSFGSFEKCIKLLYRPVTPIHNNATKWPEWQQMYRCVYYTNRISSGIRILINCPMNIYEFLAFFLENF